MLQWLISQLLIPNGAIMYSNSDSSFNLLECKICCLEFSVDDENLTPRMLTCGHTICQKCAGRLLKDRNIHCPFDRTRMSYVDNVTRLAKNFLLIEILEEKKKKVEKKAVKPEKLSVVKCVESEDHNAELYCDNCEAVFCESCFSLVHSLKVNASHKKLPLSEKPYQLPKCLKHPKNSAELLCSCSSEPFCHTCLVTSHHSHSFEELAVKIDRETKKLCGSLNKITLTRNQLRDEIEKLEVMESKYSKDNVEFRKLNDEIDRFFELKKKLAKYLLNSFVKDQNNVAQVAKKQLSEELAYVEDLKVQILNAIGSTSNFSFKEAAVLPKQVKQVAGSLENLIYQRRFKAYPDLEKLCDV